MSASIDIPAESARSSMVSETPRNTLQEEESHVDQNSIDDSLEENRMGGNNKLIDIKDDKLIVSSAAQNERYNLVERPNFLFQFEMKE